MFNCGNNESHILFTEQKFPMA
uniref:Uncharacterized protein n=1 Tax=Anguilla anguilla TaxID=7936 RepID=A0A0E9UBM1_ANGAN